MSDTSAAAVPFDVPQTGKASWWRLTGMFPRGSGMRFCLGFAAVAVISAWIWACLPRRYESTAIVVLSADTGPDTADGARPLRAFPDEAVTQSEIDLISSPRLAAMVVERLRLTQVPEFAGAGVLWTALSDFPGMHFLKGDPAAISKEEVRRRLEKRLKVTRDKRSYTVAFGYWSSDAKLASEMTNALLEAYVSMQAERRRQSISRVTGWLAERLDEARAETVRSEDAVRDFMRTSGLADEGGQAALEHELSELSADGARAKSQVIDAEVKSSTLMALKISGHLQEAPDILASPSIQKMREALSASTVNRPGGWVPEARILGDQIDTEADRIVAAAATELQSARQREAYLAAEIDGIKKVLSERGMARTRLEALKREARANGAVLEQSIVKLRERAALSVAVAPELQVSAMPEPAPKPSFPDGVLALIGTVVAGCLCGYMVALQPALSKAVPARVKRGLEAA